MNRCGHFQGCRILKSFQSKALFSFLITFVAALENQEAQQRGKTESQLKKRKLLINVISGVLGNTCENFVTLNEKYSRSVLKFFILEVDFPFYSLAVTALKIFSQCNIHVI